MSDLFGSLTAATRALEAQRFALDVTGQNIANVNTPGYSRRVIDFAAVPPDRPQSAGRGVDVIGVRATRDRMIERRLLHELSAERRDAALADALAVVETTLGQPGQSIDARLSEFFDAFAVLADDPTSPVARQEVLAQGEALSAAFRNMAERLVTAQRDADNKVHASVEEINALTARIADLNTAIPAGGSSTSALHLRDEQTKLVKQLSEIVEVAVLEREGGGVDVTLATGEALVIGEHSYALEATPVAPAGLATLSLNGSDVTARITGGRLGGLLQVRDTDIPGYQDRLDALAFGVADTVNVAHAAGQGLDGGTGRAFFAFDPAITGTAGAARSIGVDPAIAADVSTIAAAAAGGAAGDNQTARTIAGLADARVLDGGTATFADGWANLVYRVGRDAQAAAQEQESAREVVNQVEALRDQVSGISLDEEAMLLLRFQRAYEANARFFQAVDRTLEMLLQTLGR